MGNYLYDDYEAKMKVTNDVINDLNFYDKLKENFVSPKKIFCFVQIIFATFKCPPYHTKFLQIFYNNLNILERDENFKIVEELKDDLTQKHLSFHESYNNFNGKLCKIIDETRDMSIYNHSLVKPKKDALDYFFLYVNYHRYDFEKVKSRIKLLVKEINTYPNLVETDATIQKIVSEEMQDNQKVESTYIGQMIDGKREGKGMLILKNISNGQTISTYIGEFKDNKKNGDGLLKEEGQQTEGTFVDNEPDGKMGVYTDSGTYYIEYKNGIRNGRYIGLNKNGDIFTKEYINDEIAGPFSYYLTEGEFFTGKKLNDNEIEGVYYSKEEGSVDVGTFDNNFNLYGEGYRYRNNNSLFCSFDNGNILPSPCYKCLSSGRITFGYCNERARLNGKDILTFLYTNDEYKGDLMIMDYENGLEKGKSEYYWGDGDYEKIFPDGWGFRVFDNNQQIFEGHLEGGFPSGRGNFTYKGTKYSGLYKLNETRCLFISDSGKAYSCGISHTARFNEAEATQYKTNVNN